MKGAKNLKKKKLKEFQPFKYKKRGINYKKEINQCQKSYKKLDNFKHQVY